MLRQAEQYILRNLYFPFGNISQQHHGSVNTIWFAGMYAVINE